MEYWKQLMSLRDPRTSSWITIQNPSFIMVTLISYLYIVKVWGPRYMSNRKPYDLKYVIMMYNVIQVLLNVYFVTRIAYLAFYVAGYSPFCQGIKYQNDSYSLALIETMYYYLLVRVFDFMDTIFFILKKKFSHISVLHVVHHTIVVFSGWQFMQFGAEGQVVVGVCINAFIHVIMYTYYFLAALGGPESMREILNTWKPYLTRIQIAQFFVMIAHALIPMYMDCGYPRVLVLLAVPQVMFILGLFVNFYIQSYIKKTSNMRKNIESLATACFPNGESNTTSNVTTAKNTSFRQHAD